MANAKEKAVAKATEETVTATPSKIAVQKTSKKAVEIPEIDEFLKAGVHFGHRTSRWHPKMAPYIYTKKDGVHIIDIVQTMEMLSTALKAIQVAADEGGVLIVGTKGQAANMVEQVAKEAGAFYINNRWPGGLFTNFSMIQKSVTKLIKMEDELATGAEGLVKKEQLMLERDVMRLNKLYEGIKFMDKLPRLIIVIDSRIEKGAIREANNANIPVVSLVDTNCDPEIVTYPVPANDDSIKSISLFLDLVGKALKGGKRSDAVVALRNGHEAQLKAVRAEYDNKVALQKLAEEAERERMKLLRAGKEVAATTVASAKSSATKAAKNTESSVIRVVKKVEEKAAETEVKIADLDISSRTKKALEEAGYQKASQVKALAKSELLALKGVGEKAVEEILEAIKK